MRMFAETGRMVKIVRSSANALKVELVTVSLESVIVQRDIQDPLVKMFVLRSHGVLTAETDAIVMEKSAILLQEFVFVNQDIWVKSKCHAICKLSLNKN